MMNKIDNFEGKYRFLSNFYPCEITYEGIVYPSTEHAYQAAKTMCIEHREIIARLKTPGDAKKAGKIVKLREDWGEVKLDAMQEILELKFRDPILRQKLLDTDEAILIEGNLWHDNIWGDCSCPKCRDIEGKNWLGLLLIEIRGTLKGKT